MSKFFHGVAAMGRLFVDDVRRLFSNVVAVICVIGLIAIPSLFAWFNIAASWDPFGNMKNLKFAVANVDKGYKSDLIPMRISVGDNVVDALRANSQLDWTFTTKQDALEGTKSGEYYAAIVIPADFSKQMLTFFSSDAKHAVIDYYRNEKKSALAPNLTGEGADEVAAQVNQEFASTLVSAGLGIASSLLDIMDKPAASQAMQAFSSNIAGFGEGLTQTSELLGTYATLTGSAQTLLSEANALTGTSSGAVDKATKRFAEIDLGTSDLSGAVTSAADALTDALKQSAKGFDSIGTNLDDLFNQTDATVADVSASIRSMADTVGVQQAEFQRIANKLTELSHLPVVGGLLDPSIATLNKVAGTLGKLVDKLNQAADTVDGKAADTQATRDQIKQLADEAAQSIAGLDTDFTKDINPSLTKLTKDLASTTGTLKDGANQLSSLLTGLASTTASAATSLSDVEDLLNSMAKQLAKAGKSVSSFQTKLDGALAGGDLGTVKQLLAGNTEQLAASLAAPVQLKRKAVFPVENFGSTMAPYYTFVPLWTASLLIAMTIGTSVSRRRREEFTALMPHQLFLGHFGVFALVSLLQSTVSCAGSLLFLRVQAVHPWLFMLSGWVSGLLFVLFAYTLVLSFGNVGKAIGMFLLVLQVSGSAGSYPAEVLPGFMQRLTPFLPITHAINAMRAAIAGIYDNDYWHEIGMLLAFVPPLLLLGLLLRKPLIRFNRWVDEQLHSTKLIG